MTKRDSSQTDREFFETRVFRPETPCWNWRAYVGKNGYGKWVRSDRQASAHRVAYELFVGPIPKGMQLHHKCFNRSCVNPEHLEPVTARENKAMSLGVGAINKAKTHCPHGHPLDGVNARGRYCMTCNRETRVRLKEADPNYQRLQRECKNGHPRTPENTVWSKDGTRRRCRDCRIATKRRASGNASAAVSNRPKGPVSRRGR